MTTNAHKQKRLGMTLIELTVLVVVLVLFLGMAFIGVNAWKAGSDRTACVLNIYHAQEAVRSFSNLNGYEAGQTLVSVDVEAHVFGPDGFVSARPTCPGDGNYSTIGDMIPAYGILYLNCSLAAVSKHQPEDFDQW